MTKRSGKRKSHAKEESRIEPIPSTDPAARDEGPRLLPLRTPKEQEILTGKKYLDLADRALNGPHPRR